MKTGRPTQGSDKIPGHLPLRPSRTNALTSHIHGAERVGIRKYQNRSKMQSL